ncbi:hypothetical protein EVAR_90801_1 [Eumeta japonica]|uniref:Uncharacterized protein n=1 Tax=Eumeta variegata TaxID=151549 RepID=A0A4C2A373_EUMVA|nr:hypothetical protein EVAR_90801_1 [Eumeta japonica]
MSDSISRGRHGRYTGHNVDAGADGRGRTPLSFAGEHHPRCGVFTASRAVRAVLLILSDHSIDLVTKLARARTARNLYYKFFNRGLKGYVKYWDGYVFTAKRPPDVSTPDVLGGGVGRLRINFEILKTMIADQFFGLTESVRNERRGMTTLQVCDTCELTTRTLHVYLG